MNGLSFVVNGAWCVDVVSDTAEALERGKELAGEMSAYIAATDDIGTLTNVLSSMPATDNPTAMAFLFELMKSDDEQVSFYAGYSAQWLDTQQAA